MTGHTPTRRTVLRSIGVTGTALTATAPAVALQGDEGGEGGDGSEEGGNGEDGSEEGENGEGGDGDGEDGGGEAEEGTSITLLHDTHTHGTLGDADEAENVEHYFGLMDHLAADAEHALRLGNGDDLGSSALSAKFEGAHTVEAFEAGGLSHDTFGNHDFDFGPEVLRDRVAETTEFQWVSANCVDASSGDVFAAEAGAERFDVVDVDGVGVGVTGLLTERAREVTNLGPDAEVRDPVDAMREVVPTMRAAGADVVVVLSHVTNGTAVEVAEAVDGIDAVVGDDAAEILGARTVNDTVLAFVGDEYDHLGELTLDVREGTVDDHEFTLHETAAAVPDLGVDPHDAVQAVAFEYRSAVERTVIGRSEVPLNCVTADLRTGETNVGNFVADAVRADVDADVVIQNGGGIRTGARYEAGEVTDLLVGQILPFGNEAVALRIDGATLREALEHGVSEVDALHGRFPQVSGLSFTWSPDAPAGDRVTSVTVDGEPLDPEATYRLGTNGFLADGGDGYDVLTDAPVVATGGDLADVVIDRIERRSPIAPDVEGRITTVAGTAFGLDSAIVPHGESGTVSLSLATAADGFAGCYLTVSVADPDVATIENVAPGPAFDLNRSAVASDGSSADLALVDLTDAVQPGASDLELATIEVVGTGPGATELAVDVHSLDDDTGAAVSAATQTGRLVTGPPALEEDGAAPLDSDRDEVFDDVNGNGRLDYDDVVTLFENLESEAGTEHAGAFDVNGNGRLDYQDVVGLYEQI